MEVLEDHRVARGIEENKEELEDGTTWGESCFKETQRLLEGRIEEHQKNRTKKCTEAEEKQATYRVHLQSLFLHFSDARSLGLVPWDPAKQNSRTTKSNMDSLKSARRMEKGRRYLCSKGGKVYRYSTGFTGISWPRQLVTNNSYPQLVPKCKQMD